jgi:hypothetical protein
MDGLEPIDCRVRFLSFLGIGKNVQQAAFIMHTAQVNQRFCVYCGARANMGMRLRFRCISPSEPNQKNVFNCWRSRRNIVRTDYIGPPPPKKKKKKRKKDLKAKGSVAEPVHFCAASAPAWQKFWLQLRPFSPYILENSKFFMVSKKMLCFLKTSKGSLK